MIYEYLNLYDTPERFIIWPSDAHEILVIDRHTNDITVTGDKAVVPNSVQPQAIYGIWGIVRLLAGPYLVVIKERKLVGNLGEHQIWRVQSSEVLPFGRSTLHLTEQLSADNTTYLQMINEMLNTPAYYFSYTFDITHCMQRLSETSPEFRSLSLSERADERFVWNYHLLSELRQQQGLGAFTLPIMHGFIGICSAVIDGKAFDYALISRRSRLRAGVRFYMRGIDEFGCAANFVETEQIVQVQGQKFSFVITRGSVPLVWSQYPNLAYKPNPYISTDRQQQVNLFVAHFNDQVITHNYGGQVIVNLLDIGGKERELCSQFTKMSNLPEVSNRADIRYEHFDFHRECSKMRWDRLSLLLERTDNDHQAMGYFHTNAEGLIVRAQKSVFRVNCIDCLDRTNVVQSMLAKRALLQQFQTIGWLAPNQTIISAEFEKIYKNLWADNADMLATQYTGTGALKSDFTRTGKRTRYGMLLDGYNSLMRYVKNNFTDGFKQDAIDLFLGNYQPDPAIASPFAAGRDWKTKFIPVVLLFGLAMLLMSILLPPEHWTELMLFSLFWSTFVVLAIFGIYYYGEDFVDRPRLALRIGKQRRKSSYDR